MLNTWKSRNFHQDLSENDAICIQLAKFLNDNHVNEFKVVQMSDNYLEIVYR